MLNPGTVPLQGQALFYSGIGRKLVEHMKTNRLGATLAAAVLALGGSNHSIANPDPAAATVVNGSASFTQPNASTLNVTNTPGTIINWQQFGIGANEVTRFIQQSSSSAVLNRITGQNP